jgi:hypothetical protein
MARETRRDRRRRDTHTILRVGSSNANPPRIRRFISHSIHTCDTPSVDGLSRPERPRFAAGLRKLRLRVHKVRGARDQSDEFIRLADAIAGGVRDSLEGDAIMRPLFEQAGRRGIVREV